MRKNKRSRTSDYLDGKKLEKSSLIKEVTCHCLPGLSDMSNLSDLLLQLFVTFCDICGCYPVSEVPLWNLICLHSLPVPEAPSWELSESVLCYPDPEVPLWNC
ncbi:hypothetical protein CsSME_00011631 [Camellia sinensis var. sinensis]